MINFPACMSFGQRLNNFLLLRGDRKFNESRGIPIDVVNVGNRKFSLQRGQLRVTSGR